MKTPHVCVTASGVVVGMTQAEDPPASVLTSTSYFVGGVKFLQGEKGRLGKVGIRAHSL